MTLSENIAKIGRNRQNFNGSVRGVKSTVLGKLKAFSFIVRVVTVIAARKSGTLVVLPPLMLLVGSWSWLWLGMTLAACLLGHITGTESGGIGTENTGITHQRR